MDQLINSILNNNNNNDDYNNDNNDNNNNNSNKLTPQLTEPGGSMPHPQRLANNLYLDPIPRNYIYFFNIHSNIVLQATLRPSLNNNNNNSNSNNINNNKSSCFMIGGVGNKSIKILEAILNRWHLR